MALSTSKEQPAQALEISNQAVWSLSSCKPGFGVAQLRDSSSDTYWQWVNRKLWWCIYIYIFFFYSEITKNSNPTRSDGPQPHLISIEFMKKTAVRVRELHLQHTSWTNSVIRALLAPSIAGCKLIDCLVSQPTSTQREGSGELRDCCPGTLDTAP